MLLVDLQPLNAHFFLCYFTLRPGPACPAMRSFLRWVVDLETLRLTVRLSSPYAALAFAVALRSDIPPQASSAAIVLASLTRVASSEFRPGGGFSAEMAAFFFASIAAYACHRVRFVERLSYLVGTGTYKRPFL